jgi:uroporphyrinogen-III synthase
MTIRALITRPAADAAPLADALKARGLEVTIEPLMVIETIHGVKLPLEGVQAVLFTSANGVRAFAELAARRDLPACCVGEATAEAARAAGFSEVGVAGGDVRDLAALVRDTLAPDKGPLLHAAGSAVAGDLAQLLGEHGFTVRRVEVYTATPMKALSDNTVRAVAAAEFDMVLLFSPRTAAIFVRLIEEAAGGPGSGKPSREALAVGCAKMQALCLSAAVAQAGEGITWHATRIAERPDLEGMLALVDQGVAEIKGDTAGRARGPEELLTEAELVALSRAASPPTAAASSAGAARNAAAAAPQPAVVPTPAPAATGRGRGGTVLLAALVAAVVALVLVFAQPWWQGLLGIGPRVEPSAAPDTALTSRLAAAEERIGQMQAAIQALDLRLSAFQNMLADLQVNVTAIKQIADAAAAAPGTAALPETVAALPERVADLDRRLSDLAAARPPADATAVQGQIEAARAEAKAELASLRDTLVKQAADAATELAALRQLMQRGGAERQDLATLMAALDGRIAGLEKLVGGQRTEVAGAALVLAIAQLRSAIDSGRAFAGELATLERVAASAPGLTESIEPLVAPLRDVAAVGVPTLAQLRESFPAVADAIMQATNKQAVSEAVGNKEDGWVGRVVDRVSGLVTVRPVGEAEGNSPGARVARAEARLAEGNLADAVSELAALEGEPAKASAPWLARARARLVGQGALDELQRTAIDRVSALAGSAPAAAPPAKAEAPAAPTPPAEAATPPSGVPPTEAAPGAPAAPGG